MKFSDFGNKFSQQAGIASLMDDLGNSLSEDSDMIMMGGGNPAHIPEIQHYFKQRLSKICTSERELQRIIGIYDPPQGNVEFIQSLTTLLNSEYSWGLSPENIAITNGSQAAFFMLFNLFAGAVKGENDRVIQLPIAPEYIGYSDVGLSESFFEFTKPIIEEIDSESFKYHIDFDEFSVSAQTAAVCVSRPTNPTGNVLTNTEITRLDEISRQSNVPLIIDGAYGTPFPSLIFGSAEPIWNNNIILCLSLSKFGLPAARTGIVIANAEVIQAISRMNAVLNLASGNFGSLLALELVKNKKILELSQKVIRPYYFEKAQRAESLLKQLLQGLPFSLHKVEGAMFLWLRLKDCPVSNQELYILLKQQGVLIVSGHHFFPGFDADSCGEWVHTRECIRITYSQEQSTVERGLRMIAKVIHQVYQLGV